MSGRNNNGAVANGGGERPPLVQAAQEGNIQLCRTLLKRGTHVNTPCLKQGLTPLMAAAMDGHAEVCQLLLDRGADIKSVATTKDTALHCAVFHNRPDVCTVLLKGGADANAVNASQYTPLHFAIERGYINIFDDLMKHGANPNMTTPRETSLSLAARFGYHDIASKLLKEHHVEVDQLYQGRTPLLAAVRGGHNENVFNRVTELLLDCGADPNLLAADGITPLAATAFGGSILTYSLLLDRGAKDSSEGFSPLLAAVINGHEDLCCFLLKRGANPNEIAVCSGGKCKFAVLFAALALERVAIARHLIQAGADAKLMPLTHGQAATAVKFLRSVKAVEEGDPPTDEVSCRKHVLSRPELATSP